MKQNLSKYQVGDRVWHARCDWVPVKKLCPVCYGKLKVTLILGNEDSVTMPCDYCRVGFSTPTGQIEEHEYVFEPKLVTITAVELLVTETETQVEYLGGCYVYKEDTLFRDKAEATVKGEKLKADLDKKQGTEAASIKIKRHEKYSWNAGYHLQLAKRDRESAERHEQMAVLCKAKARTDGRSK